MRPEPLLQLSKPVDDGDYDELRGQAISLAEQAINDLEYSDETCPIIYADRVYLGFAEERRLRVVCFETNSRRPQPVARRRAG